MKTQLQSVAAVCLLFAAALPLVAHGTDAWPDEASPTLVASAVTPTEDRSGCSHDTMMSPLQKRLLLKYDQSPESLMQYVWITRSIYLLDRMETAQWAERHRSAHPKC